jgi:hypothetical protein
MGRGANNNLLYSDGLSKTLSGDNLPRINNQEIEKMSPLLQGYSSQIKEIELSGFLMSTRKIACSGHLSSDPAYKTWSGNDYFCIQLPRLPDYLNNSKLKLVSAEDELTLINSSFSEIVKENGNCDKAKIVADNLINNKVQLFSVASEKDNYQYGWVSLNELAIIEKMAHRLTEDGGHWRVSVNQNWLYYVDNKNKRNLAVLLISTDPDLDYIV